MASRSRIFLLSPAHCGGKRAAMLFREGARFDLAMRLRGGQGAALGEVFSFLSGLYFRGKLAYARCFANAPADLAGQFIITSNRGLVRADEYVTLSELGRMAKVPIDAADRRYRAPLLKSLRELRDRANGCEIVLLGSIASEKYVDILRDVLGPRLHFPIDFVGRGDMSRGGLMLRCVHEQRELAYVPIDGAVRRGQRPARLDPRTRPAALVRHTTII